MSELPQHPDLFWTRDRSALVEEGDPKAAFLAYAAADPVEEEHLPLLKGRGSKPAPETGTNPDPEAPAKPATKPAAKAK